jgi:tyrosine-protein phosphatase SIW14
VAIKNFLKVTESLYRGGQPDSEGFEQLKQLGVKTIISLRWSSEIRARQRCEAKAMGFQYISIPLSYFIFPSQSQIDKFFSIVNDPAYQPVFVHCKHGADRTGMMMAFYRMTFENWRVEDAYAEMNKLGFHKMFVYHYKYAVFRYARNLALKKQQNQDN